jgi:CopG antitoxin of type II toxin-antitoxin system
MSSIPTAHRETIKAKIPSFKNEDEARQFWAKADSTLYIDWSAAQRKKLVNLKPPSRS